MYEIAHEWGQDPAIVKTVADLRRYIKYARLGDKTIALVPTMGALHDGHLELVRQGLKIADKVIVSIFVNPTQFAPHEDLSAYPRTWDADLDKIVNIGAHAVFFPSVAEMYPDGFQTNISVGGVSEPLEGASRPGHFDGVATIVAKLLLQCTPDMALFGEKDWQQLQVIKQMVRDLDLPVEIHGVGIVRDDNGLALSSRNAYLDEAQYNIACHLNKTLFSMAKKIKSNESIDDVCKWGASQLELSGFDSVDYLEVKDAVTLGKAAINPLRILAAVKIGKTRLIDNIPA